MAGRPRLYGSKAEKMHAYRQRRNNNTLVVNRWAFEQTDMRLKQLMQAVHQAKTHAHPIAQQLDTRSRFDLLDSLNRLFQEP